MKHGMLAAGGIAIAILGACRESTSLPSISVPGLTVVAGEGQTDTVLAQLARALVVQVRDSTGRLAADALVRMQCVSDSVVHDSVLLAGSSIATFGAILAESTDASGEATAHLQFGSRAGRGHVAVSVPRFGYQDTVTYTILPGAAVGLTAAPRDTALYVGNSYSIRAYLFDAHGNRRADSLVYAPLDAGVTVSALGTVTGAAFARSAVLVSSRGASFSDTVRASVVPQGTFAAFVYSALYPANVIVTMNLDGSGRTVVPQSAGDNNYLQWSPSGTSILLYRPATGGHLYTMSLSGTLTQLIPAAGFAEDNWGRYNGDGTYLYFRGARFSGQFGSIWRLVVNHVGPDSVPVGSGTQPAPSPDGMRVVYVDSVDSRLHVYNYRSGTDTSLFVGGWAPHWSPGGLWIAYASGPLGDLALIRPDGTGRRTLSAGANFDWSFDWSPDSQWVIAMENSLDLLELVQVGSGLTLPLPFTAGLDRPAWKR
jgi:hypothetical protein